MKLTRTVPMAILVITALSACAQLPAGTSTSPGSTSAQGMPAMQPNERMAMMDTQMKSMREMHGRMMGARNPDERNAMRAEHRKMMHDGMAMMGGMGPAGQMSGPNGMHGMGTMPADMTQRQQMMEKRMEMMQSMMQMMMDQMPPAPARP